MIDFDINAKSTLNLLENTHHYCPRAVFIFMSTNKVYGDNPNKLKLLEKTRWEISSNNNFSKGINENMSIDNNIHSFFGVSKTYADLIVQNTVKILDSTALVLEQVDYWTSTCWNKATWFFIISSKVID